MAKRVHNSDLEHSSISAKLITSFVPTHAPPEALTKRWEATKGCYNLPSFLPQEYPTSYVLFSKLSYHQNECYLLTSYIHDIYFNSVRPNPKVRVVISGFIFLVTETVQDINGPQNVIFRIVRSSQHLP